jgi:N-acetylglutamate synthase and related acetyltransferases
MEYRFADGSDADFALLCAELDECLEELVGGKFDRSQYTQYNQTDDIHDVILVYDQNEPVGCASYKKYDSEPAEVKRVFIRPQYRGQGISKIMLKKLEMRAVEQGYRAFILEAGELLVSAMKLYEVLGYVIVPNYGQYAEMPDSICMRKYL